MKVMDPILIPMEEKKIWLKKIGNACYASKKEDRFTKKKKPKLPGQNKTSQ